MKKKILITGASGFIGSFLVEEALRQGYEVYAGVRSTSSRQFLRQESLRFFELAFSAPSLLKQQFIHFREKHGSFDFVIHNAGITQAKKRKDFLTVNFEYTKNLTEALLASSMSLTKFVLISSLASYGPGDEKAMRPIDVADVHQPISEYGKSKLQATRYIGSLTQLPHLIIHPTGVYGPRDKDFFQFIKLVNKGVEPYVGRHKQSLSLIYVKDLAKAVVALLPLPVVNCAYLLSDGNGYDKEQIGVEARRSLNKRTIKIKLPLKLVKMAVTGIDGLHRVLFNRLPFINREKLDEICSANWLCNSKAVWKDINDQPSYSLSQGIEETIIWYKEQKWL